MEALAGFTFLIMIALIFSTVVQAVRSARLKKRIETAEKQFETDDLRVEQLDKLAGQLQVRVDMLSQTRRD